MNGTGVSVFMKPVCQKLCSQAMVDDVADLSIEKMPQYNLHKDETVTILDEEPEVTPEWGDQYSNAEMLLPRGNNMTRGWVVHWKYANGNPVVISNQNPILDPCLKKIAVVQMKIEGEKLNIILVSHL